MAAGRLAGTLGTVGKKVLPRFRDMFVQALPEALGGGLLTGGAHLIMGGKPDEALAYGLADTVGSAATLGLLSKAGIQNPLARTGANFITGAVTSRALTDTLFKDRYSQQALQGQGGQAVTNAQQQAQRGNVNGMTMDELAGKYMEDTMFQQLQGAMQGGQQQGDLVRMMNSMGPTYDMNAARNNMASIMGV
jgi:hypothetical protein